MIAIAGQSVDAGSHEEARAEFISQAEQLEDVALTIANMHAAPGIVDQGGRLPQVQQPLDAFLLFDRNARRIDPALQGGGALELLAAPELDGAQAQRQSLRRHGKARVHQDAAGGVLTQTTRLVATAIGEPLEADRFRLVALVRELSGVLENEQRAGSGLCPIARGLEVPCKNGLLVDVVVGQEPIGSLGVGPVLARERDRAADAAAKLMKQAAQSLAQSCVAELAASDLTGYPQRIVG